MRDEESKQVFEIDDALLENVFRVLMNTPVDEPVPRIAGEMQFEFVDFEKAEYKYLVLLENLLNLCQWGEWKPCLLISRKNWRLF